MNQAEQKATHADRFHSLKSAVINIRSEISTRLPDGITPDHFEAVVITAAQTDPRILDATGTSVMRAIKQAADDGLLPDGKQGFINVFSTKTKIDGQEIWIKVAQWMPMVHGIRIAGLREGIVIDAQVVFENDVFDREQGDLPRLIHKPTPLTEDPGEMVGCYAIFKRGDKILHREVMRKSQVLAAKSVARDADKSLMWKTFEDEAWRKTVIHRGIKTVPPLGNASRLASAVSRLEETPDNMIDEQRRNHVVSLAPPPVPTIPDIGVPTDIPLDLPPDDLVGHPPDLASEQQFLDSLLGLLNTVESTQELAEIEDHNESAIAELSKAGQDRAKQMFLEAAQ